MAKSESGHIGLKEDKRKLINMTVTEDFRGAHDGMTVLNYKEGITYTVPAEFARDIIASGRATEAADDAEDALTPVNKGDLNPGTISRDKTDSDGNPIIENWDSQHVNKTQQVQTATGNPVITEDGITKEIVGAGGTAPDSNLRDKDGAIVDTDGTKLTGPNEGKNISDSPENKAITGAPDNKAGEGGGKDAEDTDDEVDYRSLKKAELIEYAREQGFDVGDKDKMDDIYAMIEGKKK